MATHSSVLVWRIPPRRVEEGLSRSFSGHCIKPRVPLTCACDLRELLRVPLRGEGSCGGGGAPRDSAGSGATEEGLTSRGSRQEYWSGVPLRGI